MKMYLIIVLFSAFTSVSFGQMPSATPTQSTSQEKTFGYSLEKYKNKKPLNSQLDRKSRDSDDGETMRVETDLVINDVLVTDQSGKIITNLKKDDFVITEDGTQQTIEMFSLGEKAAISRSIILIIDYHIAQAPYIKNNIQAAKFLVDKLNPNDKMAIVTNDVKLRLDFTADKTLLKKTLDSLEKIAAEDFENFKLGTSGKAREFLNSLNIKKGATLGGGLEFETLLAVLNETFDEETRQRIIIFQGDGNEIIWLNPDKDAPYKISQSTRDDSGMKYIGEKSIRNFGFSDVKEAVESSRATIFSVITGIRFFGLSKKEQMARAKIAFQNTYKALGFNEKYLPTLTNYFQVRDAETQTAGQTAMFKVAELSGGYTSFIEKPEDAANVFSSIFTTIKSRYVFGYYPTNQVRNGKSREVKIEVKNHPEYIVTGRKSYLPQ